MTTQNTPFKLLHLHTITYKWYVCMFCTFLKECAWIMPRVLSPFCDLLSPHQLPRVITVRGCVVSEQTSPTWSLYKGPLGLDQLWEEMKDPGSWRRLQWDGVVSAALGRWKRQTGTSPVSPPPPTLDCWVDQETEMWFTRFSPCTRTSVVSAFSVWDEAC